MSNSVTDAQSSHHFSYFSSHYFSFIYYPITWFFYFYTVIPSVFSFHSKDLGGHRGLSFVCLNNVIWFIYRFILSVCVHHISHPFHLVHLLLFHTFQCPLTSSCNAHWHLHVMPIDIFMILRVYCDSCSLKIKYWELAKECWHLFTWLFSFACLFWVIVFLCVSLCVCVCVCVCHCVCVCVTVCVCARAHVCV